MSTTEAALPVAETSLSSYFARRLGECGERLDPPPQEDTLWYLATLLDRFARSEALFAWQEGRTTLRPLALLYGDAVQARSEWERCQLLRHLGDVALFGGALFPGRWARRGIGRDYLVGMGCGAYDYLSDNAPVGRHVFGDLAATFSRILGMVSEVCRPGDTDGADILSLHQRWLDGRDPDAARRLIRLGISLEEPQTH